MILVSSYRVTSTELNTSVDTFLAIHNKHYGIATAFIITLISQVQKQTQRCWGSCQGPRATQQSGCHLEGLDQPRMSASRCPPGRRWHHHDSRRGRHSGRREKPGAKPTCGSELCVRCSERANPEDGGGVRHGRDCQPDGIAFGDDGNVLELGDGTGTRHCERIKPHRTVYFKAMNFKPCDLHLNFKNCATRNQIHTLPAGSLEPSPRRLTHTMIPGQLEG